MKTYLLFVGVLAAMAIGLPVSADAQSSEQAAM